MSLALSAYRAATAAAEPFLPALLRRRAARGKEDPARMAERLGRASGARPDGPLVWLHGASVGESLSLLPVIERLRSARPDLHVLVTSGTTTAAELLAARLPAGVIHQYVPVDAPGPARRFLEHWRPGLAVFVESELWPNLLLGARARGAKLALLSARVSEESTGGWARAPAAARRLLGAFHLVLPQDDAAAARLAALGAPDHGRLNLKLVGDPLPADPVTLAAVAAAAEGRPVLLAASTHPGEEAVVLDALAPLPHDTRLVIVPRHPARGEEVARRARDRGLTTARRGAGEAFLGQDRVYVADTLGELGVWFRLCTACFVGGSLLPGVGGHNPLEPARLDRAAASGPHVDNWRSVYDALAAAAGIAFVHDAPTLAAFWRRALEGDPALCSQAEHARIFASAQTGALDAAAARLLALLP